MEALLACIEAAITSVGAMKTERPDPRRDQYLKAWNRKLLALWMEARREQIRAKGDI